MSDNRSESIRQTSFKFGFTRRKEIAKEISCVIPVVCRCLSHSIHDESMVSAICYRIRAHVFVEWSRVEVFR